MVDKEIEALQGRPQERAWISPGDSKPIQLGQSEWLLPFVAVSFVFLYSDEMAEPSSFLFCEAGLAWRRRKTSGPMAEMLPELPPPRILEVDLLRAAGEGGPAVICVFIMYCYPGTIHVHLGQANTRRSYFSGEEF